MDIRPFDDCPALDGYHCQTNSLAKLYHYHGHPLSEDLLLGLGAGMGFIYWQQKGVSPFIGGRGNMKNFFHDLGQRTGVNLRVKSTSSARKAETTLLNKISKHVPVMVYGDMGFLPWFDLPEDYHFGGHTFVICGYDGREAVLASDINQHASGLKPGFYHPMTLEQLRKSRGSTYRPYPPKNQYLECDFAAFHAPTSEDVHTAIRRTVDAMLKPPISNLGVKGIRRSSAEIGRWSDRFDDHELRMTLFSVYVFIEIGGTGGGCFRYMYARFLKEAAGITADHRLLHASAMIHEAGEAFTELGLLFKDAETATDLDERVTQAQAAFIKIAEMEEEAFKYLSEVS